MAEETPQSVQSEINELERRLQEKRAELGADASAPYERSEVHAVLGERMPQSAPPSTTPVTPASDGASWQDPAIADIVQNLVNVAFTQSLQKAIDQAVATGNPAVIDALHDVLADELHAQLLERKKIEPAP